MADSDDDLLELFRKQGALLEGHFALTSGLHSPRYLQCARVLMLPALATRLGKRLAKKLNPLLRGDEPSLVVAPAVGGILVAHEVARALGCRGLFMERQNGVMTLRRGFSVSPDELVVVVEDVVTTGGSTREVIDAVAALGARVLAAGSLVDRSGGRVDLGLPRCSLLTLEIETHPPELCPQCRAGSAPVKPGSRDLGAGSSSKAPA
jgi:orotate phosphoribosyltransferase